MDVLSGEEAQLQIHQHREEIKAIHLSPCIGKNHTAHTESSNMTYQKHVKPYQNAVSTGDAIERKEKQERKNIKSCSGSGGI